MAIFEGLLSRFRQSGGYGDGFYYDLSDYGDYTDLRLKENFRHSVHDRQLIQSVDNAVRMASLTVSRCAISIEGGLGPMWAKIVQPGRFMGLLVEDLLRYGNAVYEITAEPGLRRVSDFDVMGKRVIRYRIEHAMPDGTTARTVSAEEVLHVKIGEDRRDQWLGRSPFEGTFLLAAVERGLRDYAKIRNKRIVTSPLPQTNPQGDTGDQIRDNTAMAELFSRAGTEVFFMQNARGGMDTLKSIDLKFEPDGAALTLRDSLIDEVWAAIGVPRTLRGDAVPGQAYKTALASWIDGFLQPLADSIAEQMGLSLEVDVKIDMTPAKVPQVADQARIVSDLVKGGVPLPEAKTIAGL